MSMGETASVAAAPEPRANAYFLGHARAETLLADCAQGGRVHHAWLISGPRGIGKATLAYRFARRLLAGPAPGASADDGGQTGLFGEAEAQPAPAPAPDEVALATLALEADHPVFRRIAARSHPDLMSVERGFNAEGTRLRTEIVIDDIRKVTEFLALTAAEGGWRVVLIDGAEDMNRQAANALLKTLEEPPPRTVLLLVSHAPGRLLPTIRSRCRKLALGPLAEAEVRALIERYRPDIGTAEALLLSAVAEGSIGRALALNDAGGVALYGEMVDLLATLPRLDARRLHGVAEAVARSRAEPGAADPYEVFASLIGWWVARLVRARGTGRVPEPLVAGEEAAISGLMAAGGLDQWVEVWEKITLLFDRAARVNLDRKQVLLNAFFALARTAA